MPRNVMRGFRDRNQPIIVRVGRYVGASVLELHEVGQGAPDLLVGWAGRNRLFEIKNPDAGGKLRPDQIEWHSAWQGEPPIVIQSEFDLLEALGWVDTIEMLKIVQQARLHGGSRRVTSD